MHEFLYPWNSLALSCSLTSQQDERPDACERAKYQHQSEEPEGKQAPCSAEASEMMLSISSSATGGCHGNVERPP